MSVNKMTLDTAVKDFAAQLASFRHGKCYIGEGFYTAAELAAAFANKTTKDTELSTNYEEISDLGQKPGKEESKTKTEKTANFVIEVDRTNSVELNLVGITQERKDWLEQNLNESAKTIVLESKCRKNVLVFNGLRWVYDRTSEFNGLNTCVIKSEYSGYSEEAFAIFKGLIPAV